MSNIDYPAKYPTKGKQKAFIMDARGGCRALTATDWKQPPSVVLPVISPGRHEKQNGRHIGDDGDPSYTLTAQDIHGVAISVEDKGYERIAHAPYGNGRMDGRTGVFSEDSGIPALNATMGKEPYKVAIRVKDSNRDGYTVANVDEDSIDLKSIESKTRRGIVAPGVAHTHDHDCRQGVAVKVKEATRGGIAVAHEGDSVNLSVPGSRTRRGRVGAGVANTLDTSCNQGVVVRVSDNLTVYAIWYEKYQCYVTIRKLTPKECFRLQGWEDEYFERAAFVNSNSQLYKKAGNGVTVNVIKAIAERMKV